MEKINPAPFIIREAIGSTVPLIISIPHSGTAFPSEIIDDYIPEQVKAVDDTDWFLQDLYDFAPAMGITIVQAHYSRWVIDLNRDPESAPLYNDGRIITGLTSTTDFLGNPIYKEGKEPDQTEIDRRLATYYWPYYQQVTNLLKERIAEFGNVVLWDAHSIRESVPTIRSEKFPEMILGNADETSAHANLIKAALTELRKGYQVNHNDPFKGGHITRYFGNPDKNIHALQLERNKNMYMDNNERNFDEARAEKMRVILKATLSQLIYSVNSL
ncbi:MAG: N-formylglutamate deformylase [Crocinitomix sp.]|nr:N-formylglutamate deformylase [Crocinitomix sp.]